jgi:hypothetical protein
MREREELRALKTNIKISREGKVKRKYVYGKGRKEKWKSKDEKNICV